MSIHDLPHYTIVVCKDMIYLIDTSRDEPVCYHVVDDGIPFWEFHDYVSNIWFDFEGEIQAYATRHEIIELKLKGTQH